VYFGQIIDSLIGITTEIDSICGLRIGQCLSMGHALFGLSRIRFLLVLLLIAYIILWIGPLISQHPFPNQHTSNNHDEPAHQPANPIELGARHRHCQRSIDIIQKPEKLIYARLLPRLTHIIQIAKEIAEKALLHDPVLHIEAELDHQIFACY
jgi:hypothetical protein